MLLYYHIFLHFDLQLCLIDCCLYVAGGLLPLLAALATAELGFLAGFNLVMDLLGSLLLFWLGLTCFLPPLIVEITLMLSNIKAAIRGCKFFTL